MTSARFSAIVALGANLPSEQGDPQETLEAAVALLGTRGLRLTKRSRWFTSPAWPDASAPPYVNGAAAFATDLSARDVLDGLHKTETMLGRIRGPDRWGARPCDLDLIAYGAMVAPGLVAWRRMADAPPDTPRSEAFVPHPQMHRRAFVLVPMVEAAPRWRHPVLGRTAAEMLAALPVEERNAVEPLT